MTYKEAVLSCNSDAQLKACAFYAYISKPKGFLLSEWTITLLEGQEGLGGYAEGLSKTLFMIDVLNNGASPEEAAYMFNMPKSNFMEYIRERINGKPRETDFSVH